METALPAGGSPGDGRPALKRPSVWGWISFDFAAQPFFTVVVTFVFGPYFVARLAPDPATGQAAWAGAMTVSGLLLALAAPVLGAVADRAGPRKPWLAALALAKIAALCALWTAAPGTSLFLAAAFVVTASVAAELSIVLNDSMMPSLVERPSIGLVSNIAWGLGYGGGMIALIGTVLFLSADPDTGLTLLGLPALFGLDAAEGEGARATGPLSALWYLVFVLPMFWLVPDRSRRADPPARAIREGLAELAGTWREVRKRAALFRFMLARVLYQDGVNGVLVLGGPFAAGMFGWSVVESGLFGIILNVAAIAGCGLAGLVDRRLGSKSVVMASILCLVAATIGIVSTAPGSTLFGLVTFAAGPDGGFFDSGAEKAFLLFGGLIGIAFGPIQASSRSWLAQSVEPAEAGRYFGLYALTGRVSSFLAPLSVATLTAFAATRTDPATASRLGMSALIAFFLAGLLVLLTTRDPRHERLEDRRAG
ncbi:MFS transporter [Aureimonas populi]|uniref:MFS transporter n=1 Tax=Aureimonas populi TaxID=1701758 RepID=A0ABW5CPF4_9HYPH|nr:MFS transporter [Aureimonas populi]